MPGIPFWTCITLVHGPHFGSSSEQQSSTIVLGARNLLLNLHYPGSSPFLWVIVKQQSSMNPSKTPDGSRIPPIHANPAPPTASNLSSDIASSRFPYAPQGLGPDNDRFPNAPQSFPESSSHNYSSIQAPRHPAQVFPASTLYDGSSMHAPQQFPQSNSYNTGSVPDSQQNPQSYSHNRHPIYAPQQPTQVNPYNNSSVPDSQRLARPCSHDDSSAHAPSTGNPAYARQEPRSLPEYIICKHCAETLESLSDLEEHLARVHPQRFSCKRCCERFRTILELQSHKSESHDESLPLKCVICAVRFTHMAGLQSHYRARHPNQPIKYDVTFEPPRSPTGP